MLAHEIGHALGLIHEHQRYDRDDYISLNLDNIASHAISNFNRFKASIVDTRDLTYDFGSAMHYPATVGNSYSLYCCLIVHVFHSHVILLTSTIAILYGIVSGSSNKVTLYIGRRRHIIR